MNLLIELHFLDKFKFVTRIEVKINVQEPKERKLTADNALQNPFKETDITSRTAERRK